MFEIEAQEARDMKLHDAATEYANERIGERMTKITPADLISVTNAIDTASSEGEYIAACISGGNAQELLETIKKLVRPDVWQELYTEGWANEQ